MSSHDRIEKLNKGNIIKKLIVLVVLVTALSFLPTPPTGQTALADVEKPPSKTQLVAAKSSLTTKKVQTTHVQAPQPVPATEVVQPTTPTPAPVVDTPTQPTAPISTGSHEDIMAAAGISSADYGYVDYIVSHESGWNPDATNASSGAHGLPQALPYSKTGCGWVDGVCQLQWANSYAVARYGSWYNAYIHWVNNRNW